MKKLLYVFILLLATVARAELRINVDGAKSDPVPIAIADFKNNNTNNLGNEISRIVEENLTRSNLFRVIDKEAYIQEKIILRLLIKRSMKTDLLRLIEKK